MREREGEREREREWEREGGREGGREREGGGREDEREGGRNRKNIRRMAFVCEFLIFVNCEVFLRLMYVCI